VFAIVFSVCIFIVPKHPEATPTSISVPVRLCQDQTRWEVQFSLPKDYYFVSWFVFEPQKIPKNVQDRLEFDYELSLSGGFREAGTTHLTMESDIVQNRIEKEVSATDLEGIAEVKRREYLWPKYVLIHDPPRAVFRDAASIGFEIADNFEHGTLKLGLRNPHLLPKELCDLEVNLRIDSYMWH